jgi:hypothetical protein
MAAIGKVGDTVKSESFKFDRLEVSGTSKKCFEGLDSQWTLY